MTTTMTTAALDALVDAHFAAEIDADIDRLLSTFADDVEHDVVGNPGVSSGRAEVAVFYRQLLADLDLQTIESVHRYHGDGFVVDESIVTARAVGTPFGLPGGGRTVTFRLLHVFEFRGDEITRENAWLDLAGVLSQLGAAPPA